MTCDPGPDPEPKAAHQNMRPSRSPSPHSLQKENRRQHVQQDLSTGRFDTSPTVLAAVAIGGVLGATCRYKIANLLPYQDGFPLAIFLANVTGSFLLGGVVGSPLADTHPRLRACLGVGALGSYTTFSTFAADTRQLFAGGSAMLATFYLVASIGAGVWASGIGQQVGGRIEKTSSREETPLEATKNGKTQHSFETQGKALK